MNKLMMMAPVKADNKYSSILQLLLPEAIVVYIYSTPLLRAGCDTRSISYQSNGSLNLEITFSSTGCLTKAKEQSALLFIQSCG